MKQFQVDSLQVLQFSTREKMGSQAGLDAAKALRMAIARQGSARLILAAAPSQDELLAALVGADDLDWSKVTLFHMDEYVGLPAEHPASFRSYLREHVLAYVTPAEFYGIQGEAEDAQAELNRYSRLVAEAPIDVVCLGIGENGHIAFNDPPVADFSDPLWVKTVALDEVCRQQQVNDECFGSLKDVPTHAITLTVPALMSGTKLFCVVPGARKAAAVRAAIEDPIHPHCPATVLRLHPRATLYLDHDSAAFLS